MAPQLIFRTATFGMDMTAFQDAETVTPLMEVLKILGVSRLDTAARYPPFNPGRAEQLVGEGRFIERSDPELQRTDPKWSLQSCESVPFTRMGRCAGLMAGEDSGECLISHHNCSRNFWYCAIRMVGPSQPGIKVFTMSPLAAWRPSCSPSSAHTGCTLLATCKCLTRHTCETPIHLKTYF